MKSFDFGFALKSLKGRDVVVRRSSWGGSCQVGIDLIREMGGMSSCGSADHGRFGACILKRNQIVWRRSDIKKSRIPCWCPLNCSLDIIHFSVETQFVYKTFYPASWGKYCTGLLCWSYRGSLDHNTSRLCKSTKLVFFPSQTYKPHQEQLQNIKTGTNWQLSFVANIDGQWWKSLQFFSIFRP